MVFVMTKKTTETKETNLANFPGGGIVAKRLKTPFANIINGSLFAASEYFDVLNPADETVIAKSPSASKGQVDQAVNFAKDAFKEWRKDKNYRKECIQKCADKLQKHIEDIALLMSLEQGKPLELAQGEVKAAIGKIISILAQEVPEDIFETKEKKTFVIRHPIGVVAGICPWNYPVSIGVAKIFRPLFMGNTVVVKPASHTPLSTLYIGELIKDILPKGVFNILSGPGKTGEWLCEHPDVKFISFTGSVEVGKTIAKIAAEDLKGVSLELGGNDPSIVLPDVDLDKYAEAIFWGAFRNSGQICIASKRLYVHEDIFDNLVARLCKIASEVKVGGGLEPGVDMGPVNNAGQLKLVEDLVADAKAHGAKVMCGGERIDRAGYFYPPTIITNIKKGVRLVDEEQFGPALPVISFKDIDEVIAEVNASELGLAGSVWCGDDKQGFEIAKQVESGMMWVNHVLGGHPKAPFGGMKHSGVGREGGIWGVDMLSELQSVTVWK